MSYNKTSYISVLYSMLFISFLSLFGSLVLINFYLEKEITGKVKTTLNRQIADAVMQKTDLWNSWHSLAMDQQIVESASNLVRDLPIANVELITEKTCRNEVDVCLKLSAIDETVLRFQVDYSKHPRFVQSRVLFLTIDLFVIVMFIVFCVYILRQYKRLLILPLKNLESFAESITDHSEIILPSFQLKELDKIAGTINKLFEAVKKSAQIKAELGLAKQVAHDIRSPLSALNMIGGQIKEIPEDKRLIIRSAVQRINDIANQLLQKGQALESNISACPIKRATSELLPALVEILVSEKRTQYRDLIKVDIETDLRQSYGAFVQIDVTEFKRALSNIINNSVEAFDDNEGQIIVAVRSYVGKSVVIVQDNGKGIPDSLLHKLGEAGVTSGKDGNQSGSGLGIYQAKKAVEGSGGSMSIQSRIGVGTIITMSFPMANTPDWFVKHLEVMPYQRVVVLDDDSTIHRVWSDRFGSVLKSGQNIELLHFTRCDEFRSWVSKQLDVEVSGARGPVSFLVDYEILGASQSGLDLIEELKICDKSFLVTSHYEEASIRKRCKDLGVKLIPKGMAALVPIEIAKKEPPLNELQVDLTN